MNMTFRFAALISAGTILLSVLFSFFIYSTIKKDVLHLATENLIRHVEHEAEHASDPTHRSDLSDIHSRDKNVFFLIEKNNQLTPHTFPPALMQIFKDKTSPHHLYFEAERSSGKDHIKVRGVYDLTLTRTFLERLRTILQLGNLLGFLAIFPFSFLLARFLLRPFRQLAIQTQDLTMEDLGSPLPMVVKGSDEYGTLIQNFNALFARLYDAFQKSRRFSHSAAHELRTPLAAVKLGCEVALRRERTIDEYQTVLKNVIDQITHLTGFVERLLGLSRLSVANVEGRKELVYPKRLVEDVASMLANHARHITTLDLRLPDSDSFFSDKDILSQILMNILENAYKYGTSSIRVTGLCTAQFYTFTIEDDGPGIPMAVRDKVFEPFFRLAPDKPTPTTTTGHGLGLFLVRNYIESLQGTIRIAESTLGGTAITLTLPAI